MARAGRNPTSHQRLSESLTEVTQDVAGRVSDHQREGIWPDVPAEAIAQAIVSSVPGFRLELALRGPDVIAAVPDEVQAVFADRARRREGKLPA